LSLGMLSVSLDSLRNWLLVFVSLGFAFAGVAFLLAIRFYEKHRKAHLI